MNRTLLDQLQQLRCYPSITLLMNTRQGTTLGDDDRGTAHRLADEAAERLAALIDGDPKSLIDRIHALVEERAHEPSGQALAICVSPDHEIAISLGGPVDERVVIDETFATRDLVADLNRTVVYRVLAVSDSIIRAFVGDRQRLVEERSASWPQVRDDQISDTVWSRTVSAAVKQLDVEYPVPNVTAGVVRSTSRLLGGTGIDVIGHVSGNHDRTAASELHSLAWPLVVDWKALRQSRALDALDQARSAKRYAAGPNELWALALDGRIDHLVVEADFSLSARVDHNGHVHPTDDEGRDVTDDVVDEIIEAVLQNGGHITMVEASILAPHDRIAAVLRF